MKITVEIKNPLKQAIDGLVQIEEQIQKTSNGIATFDLDIGTHKVRPIVHGYRGSVEEVIVSENTSHITIFLKGV